LQLLRFSSDSIRNIRPWKPSCDELLDLSLGSAASLGNERIHILRRHVLREQGQATQMDLSRAKLLEHLGTPSRQPRDSHAHRGLVFTVREAFRAVARQGRARCIEINPPAIDLDQVLDDLGGTPALGQDQLRHACQKLAVSHQNQRCHSVFVPR
jgi:hypothetical protein